MVSFSSQFFIPDKQVPVNYSTLDNCSRLLPWLQSAVVDMNSIYRLVGLFPAGLAASIPAMESWQRFAYRQWRL